MTGHRRLVFSGVSPTRGGSFAASFGRKPYGRGGCRAWLPGDRPPAVPAAVPGTTPASNSRTVNVVPGCVDREAKGHSQQNGMPRIVRGAPQGSGVLP